MEKIFSESAEKTLKFPHFYHYIIKNVSKSSVIRGADGQNKI